MPATAGGGGGQQVRPGDHLAGQSRHGCLRFRGPRAGSRLCTGPLVDLSRIVDPAARGRQRQIGMRPDLGREARP